MEKQYIQLPPLERDMDPNLLPLIWQYALLPDDAKEAIKNQIDLFVNKPAEDNREEIKEQTVNISAEVLAPYEEAMKEMVRTCLQDGCHLASKVLIECYIKGRTIEELLEEMHPAAHNSLRAIEILLSEVLERNGFFEATEQAGVEE